MTTLELKPQIMVYAGIEDDDDLEDDKIDGGEEEDLFEELDEEDAY